MSDSFVIERLTRLAYGRSAENAELREYRPYHTIKRSLLLFYSPFAGPLAVACYTCCFLLGLSAPHNKDLLDTWKLELGGSDFDRCQETLNTINTRYFHESSVLIPDTERREHALVSKAGNLTLFGACLCNAFLPRYNYPYFVKQRWPFYLVGLVGIKLLDHSSLYLYSRNNALRNEAERLKQAITQRERTK